MPDSMTVSCPACARRLRVRAIVAGKRVRCPECEGVFTVPPPRPQSVRPSPVSRDQNVPVDAAPQRAQATDNHADEASQPKRKKKAKLRKAQRAQVRRGLGLVFLALILSVGNFILAIVGGTTSSVIVHYLVFGVALTTSVLALIGKCFCLNVPKSMPGKGLLIAAVACDAVALFGTLVQQFSTLALGAFTGLLAPAGFVLFVVFLKKLAEYIRKQDIADHAWDLLKIGFGMLGTLAATVILPVLAAMIALASPALVAPITLISLGCLIAVVVLAVMFVLKYGSLINELQEAM